MARTSHTGRAPEAMIIRLDIYIQQVVRRFNIKDGPPAGNSKSHTKLLVKVAIVNLYNNGIQRIIIMISQMRKKVTKSSEIEIIESAFVPVRPNRY